MDAVRVRDILIIGGGINGCGAGRGSDVLLAGVHDLAGGMYSAAIKLIYGVLRYRERREFRLINEAPAERDAVWASPPYISLPLRRAPPYHDVLRPGWLTRLVLFIDHHLSFRKLLPATRNLNTCTGRTVIPLQPLYTQAFDYLDRWVDASNFMMGTRDVLDCGTGCDACRASVLERGMCFA